MSSRTRAATEAKRKRVGKRGDGGGGGDGGESSKEIISTPAGPFAKKLIKVIGDEAARIEHARVPSHIFAIGDTHGDLGIARQCMEFARVVNSLGQWKSEIKNTVVVQVGDQIDSHREIRTPIRKEQQGDDSDDDDDDDDDVDVDDGEEGEEEGEEEEGEEGEEEEEEEEEEKRKRKVDLSEETRELKRHWQKHNHSPDVDDLYVIDYFDTMNKMARRVSGGSCAVVSLIGNHEIYNVLGDVRFVGPAGLTRFANSIKERQLAFAPGGVWARRLAHHMSLFYFIGDILFSHTGLTAQIMDTWGITSRYDLRELDAEVRLWLLGLHEIPSTRIERIVQEILGGRVLGKMPGCTALKCDNGVGTDAYRRQCDDLLVPVLERLKIRQMVIGHTPRDGISSICEGRVLAVDVAASAGFNVFTTGKRPYRCQLLAVNTKAGVYGAIFEVNPQLYDFATPLHHSGTTTTSTTRPETGSSSLSSSSPSSSSTPSTSSSSSSSTASSSSTTPSTTPTIRRTQRHSPPVTRSQRRRSSSSSGRRRRSTRGRGGTSTSSTGGRGRGRGRGRRPSVK